MSSTTSQLSHRIGTAFSCLGRTEGELIAIARKLAIRYWRAITAVGVSILLTAAALMPYEMAWLSALQSLKSPELTLIAKRLSAWGDIFPGTLIITFSLWSCGRLTHRRLLVRAGIACLLAAVLAGLFSDVFRFGLGRARPNSGLPDGLYGPTLSAKLHGFPSGHTTAALATGVSLAVALPPIGIPAVALGASVGWSRLYLNWHRPTDVLVGATIGSLFGLAFGLAARESKR